jgi:unsaturated rhamnogalacturonyl hydrolase
MAPFAPEAGELRELMGRIVARSSHIDFLWDWPGGVAFYGVCRAYEAVGEKAWLEGAIAWVEAHLEAGLPPLSVNAVSVGHCLISLHEATGDEKYLSLALRLAEFLEKEALRFRGGVLQHTVSAKNDFPGQAWADTLFMAAYFLLRMGVKTGNAAWVDDALKQWQWHEELLQDETSHLFYHAWDERSQGHLSGVFWARGNAWAAYTMARATRLVNYMYPLFMAIEGALRDQLSALARLQSPEGLWHTVLDDPGSYCETSASAGIAAAMALRAHPLHEKKVELAYRGLLAQIGPDGAVRNVSGGTAVMADVSAYKSIPRKRAQGWGQGLALAFLSALYERSGGKEP